MQGGNRWIGSTFTQFSRVAFEGPHVNSRRDVYRDLADSATADMHVHERSPSNRRCAIYENDPIQVAPCRHFLPCRVGSQERCRRVIAGASNAALLQ